MPGALLNTCGCWVSLSCCWSRFVFLTVARFSVFRGREYFFSLVAGSCQSQVTDASVSVPDISGSLPEVSGDVSVPSVGAGGGADVDVAVPSVDVDASMPSASIDLPGECAQRQVYRLYGARQHCAETAVDLLVSARFKSYTHWTDHPFAPHDVDI